MILTIHNPPEHLGGILASDGFQKMLRSNFEAEFGTDDVGMLVFKFAKSPVMEKGMGTLCEGATGALAGKDAQVNRLVMRTILESYLHLQDDVGQFQPPRGMIH